VSALRRDRDGESRLDGDPETDVSAAWDAEIKRRVDQVRDGSVEGDALSEAIAELDEVVDE
jgi:hypothetical protein